MLNENPWFLVTYEEIAAIHLQLRILDQEPKGQHAQADAIREILDTVVQRQMD